MDVPFHSCTLGVFEASKLGSRTESPGAYMSTQGPYAVLKERRSTILPEGDRTTDDAPTTMVPSAFPGDTRQALISRLPADTTTGIPTARRRATALSSSGIRDAVSAMNDQFATAGRPCFFASSMTHFVPSTMARMV